MSEEKEDRESRSGEVDLMIRSEPAARRVKPIPTLDDLKRLEGELETSSPQEILAWALETYKPRIALACSFGGPSGMVLLDMVTQLDPSTRVFYLDTGLLFAETYALAAEAQRRYGIPLRAVRPGLTLAQQSAQYGDALWARNPDRCCELRKVIPQRKALKGYDAWITGLRRDQASTRRGIAVVEWDSTFGLAKVNPLATWDEGDV